jgi:branched-chain amino acid transport system permease protein
VLAAVRRIRIETLGLAIVGIVVILGIPLLTDEYNTFQWATVGIYVTALIGLNLLTGYSGQISLGNGAFMAVGGYTTAILVHTFHWPYLATIPLAGLLAGVTGFVFGIPALRLSGLFLALATFALALATPSVIKNYGGLTGGHDGLLMKPARPPAELSFLGFSLEQWLYYMAWAIAALLFVFTVGLLRSRTGRAFMAIRDSETAAVSSGINLARYKTLAFGLSAFYAGIAGSQLSISLAFAHPDAFDFGLSLALLVGIVLGGLGTSIGPIFGAAAVVWLPKLAERVAPGGKPDIPYGILLILVMFVMPFGFAGLLIRIRFWYARLRGSRRAAEMMVPAVTESAAPDAGDKG